MKTYPCVVCKRTKKQIGELGHKTWCSFYKGTKKICGCQRRATCGHSQSPRDYGGVGM